MKVAETYGTPQCAFDDKLVAEWKSKLKKLVGAQAPPSLSIKGRLEYKSPLDAEVLQAWAERGNDRETEVPKWIRSGAQLGIEEPIGTFGIFPKASCEDPYAFAEAELMDAQAQLSRSDITNYKSVAEDVSNATIELERYKNEGYLVELSKEEVLRNMSHGTISRLGLICSQGEARGHQASNHHRPEKKRGKLKGDSPGEAGPPTTEGRLGLRSRPVRPTARRAESRASGWT